MWEATARIKERATKEGENGATQEVKVPGNKNNTVKLKKKSNSGLNDRIRLKLLTWKIKSR